MHRTILLAVVTILLLVSASVVVPTAQADPPPGVDSAERDDLVPEDDSDEATEADDGGDTRLPKVDTAERDDIVPEEGGDSVAGADEGSEGRLPKVDTAERDDVVPEDGGGGVAGADEGSEGRLPKVDTAERDDVVPEDGGGGVAGADDGSEGRLPKVDTAERDDVVPEDGGGVSGANDGSAGNLPNVDTAERDDVVPEDGGGVSGAAAKAPAPTGLRVVSDTDDSVRLSWTSVSNAARYKVEYRKSSSSIWLHAGYTSSRTYTVDGLLCNTAYKFRVKARGDGSPYSYTYGTPSSSVSETTDRCTAPAPTGLKVTSDTDDSVSLKWTAVTDAGAYKVEYRKVSSGSWLHASYVYSGTTKTVGSLLCNTAYQFRVKARGDGSPYSYIYGTPSSSVSETTDRCPPPSPPAPTGLRVTSDTDDSVSLSWTAVSNAAAYKVEYRKGSSGSWLHASYVYSGTTKTVDRLTCNTAYQFRVKARGDGSPYAASYGAASTSVSETTDRCPPPTPPAPTGLRVTSDTGDSVSLSWTAVSDAGAYKVEYRKGSSGSWLHASYVYSGTTKTVAGLTCNTAYQFRVKARGDGSPYAASYGAASTSVSETTDRCPPPAPTGLRVTSDTGGSVSLSWTAVSDAGGYKVEYRQTGTINWLHAKYVFSRTSTTVSSLVCNTAYQFRVKARGDGSPYAISYGSPSTSVSETTDGCVPPAPTGLRVTSDTDDSVSLSWYAVHDAGAYKVEYRKSSSSRWLHASYVYSGTSDTVDSLLCNTAYEFRVRARGDGSPYLRSYGNASTSVSETTDECPLAPAPTGLRVTGYTDESVSLRWDPVTDAHGYKLERRKGTTGTWAAVGSETGRTSQTATGLDCNSTYYFRVSARGDGSPYSTTFGNPSTGNVSQTTSTCIPVFQFTPSPLALGGTSNTWTVPAGVTSVYVDVSFSRGSVKDRGSGEIAVNRVDSSGTVLGTKAVRSETDSGAVTGARAGSRIRINVDSDAFDSSSALVTLAFHSGVDDSGPVIARATVQKESMPQAPTNGSASVEKVSGSVTLSWESGALRSGSIPDHYEVVIPDTANPSTPFYSNRNIDDSSSPTTLTISNARTLGLEGTHTAEVRHCNASGGCSLPLGIPFTLPAGPTISVDPQDVFTGQTVTMTVATPSASGPVSSYRWQEFVAGRWINLTSTTYNQSVTSSASMERVFRVVVTYASRVTMTSSSVRIEWRPIVVTVTASPTNPKSSDASKSTVVLTASADAPSDVTYRWQQGNGDTWTNLGSLSTSASKTVSFTSRGTRKFRVVVSHSVVPAETSAPVYVTWDERSIVGDMVTALRTAVVGDTTYTTAQTALLTCMNNDPSKSSSPTYMSFDDILSDYTGSTKIRMDRGGACNTQATAMFNAVQTLSSSKLASLKTTNTEYAALLETPQGLEFATNVGTSEIFRQDASQLADVIALDRATIGGVSGASSPTAHGFESCLPSDTNPDLTTKFKTLNCLQFEKPHSLWVALHGDRAKQLALKEDLDDYTWLQYDNFACSNRFGFVDLPDPASGLPCLKHDISYASLQVFIADSGKHSETLDVAWNPRNKFLADHLFVIDGICGMRVGEQRRECVPEAADNHGILDTLMHMSWWVPKLNHFGVSGINDKGWPVTKHDVAHAKQNMEYLSCDVPKISNINIVYRSGRDFDVAWTPAPGCVQDISIHSYKFCFDRTYSFFFFRRTVPMCTTLTLSNTPNTGSFTVPYGTSSVTLVSVALRPNDNLNEDLYYPKMLFASEIPVRRK